MHGGIRLAYYGDDFTGSTDTLAAVVAAGWRAVLFLDVPEPQDLAAFGPLDCIGVAGTARAMSPAEMDADLPRIFRGLAATGAQVLHYKTCSTFDSAPHIGSIGHAIGLARRTLGPRPAFIVGGQPNLGRYCVFANLYARAGQGGPLYRIDRHPTMRQHPVTPMDEADLRVHLERQGLAGVASFDAEMLEEDGVAQARRLAALCADGAGTVLFDVVRPAHLARIGALLWGFQRSGRQPLLAVGPTGATQALLAAAQLPPAPMTDGEPPRSSGPAEAPAGPPISGQGMSTARAPRAVSQTFVIAGSRSPVTAAQIGAAEHAGFASIALDPMAMAGNDTVYGDALARRIVGLLREGRSVVAHSTLADDSAAHRPGFTRALATSCGRLMAEILARHPLERVGLAGGDTSSLAVQSWGARALTLAFVASPGVAVCRVHAPGHAANGVELMLKGGQMGPPDLFARLLNSA
ncbi:hypothetical protein BAU07_24490 [Bordetella flabilis]|uniref:Type III effector n=2 Tax=Bordetella flabilis TaxID=463014 RepID=A0A193GIF5_9BORD|nr:hypothetical protein BAU07_24490 [Bordetella flabilis]